MTMPSHAPPPVTKKTVYRLGEVIGGFLRGLAQAQAIAEEYSLELADLYAAPASALDAFSVPNAELRSVEVDLKCAILGLSHPRPARGAADGAPEELAGGGGERVVFVEAGNGKPLPNVDVIIDAYSLRDLPPEVLCSLRFRIEVGNFPVNEIFAEEEDPSLSLDAPAPLDERAPGPVKPKRAVRRR
jgi:hypothetical protein